MKQSIIKGAYWLTLSKVVIQVLNLSANIYIANLLLPSDYALMGIAMVFIGLMQFLTEFGLSEVITQRKNLENSEINFIFWFAAVIGFVLSIMCFILAGTVETFFEKGNLKSILQVLSPFLFLHSLSIVPYKLIDRKLKFRLKAAIDLICKTISLISAVILASIGFGVWSLVYAHLVYVITLGFFSFLFEPFVPYLSFQFAKFADMTRFGFKIIILRILWFFRNQVGNIIGGKFLSVHAFGHYAFAFQLARNLQSIILNVMSIISIPALARYQEDDAKINKAFLMLIKYTALFTFPLFIGGAVLSSEIITILLPEKWQPTIPIFSVACIVMLNLMLIATYENFYIAKGKPQYSVILNIIIGTALTVSFFLGVQWGMNGMLAAWMIVLPASVIGWTGFTLKNCGIPFSDFLKSVELPTIGSTAMVLVLLTIKYFLLGDIGYSDKFEMLPYLLFALLASAITYCAIIYLRDKTIFKILLSKTKVEVTQ